MSGMALPSIPTFDGVPFPVGRVVTADDMNALAYCCQFAMNKPYTRVHATSTQSIPSATPVAINFQAADQDSDGMWASGSPGLLTIQTPGYYKVRYAVGAPNSGCNGFIQGLTGANNPAGSGQTIAPQWGSYFLGTTAVGCLGASGIIKQYLFPGDTLSVMFSRPAGAIVTILTDVPPWFSLEWVSA